MPLRQTGNLTFRAHGLSDAIDGSNAFAGAMRSLQNLIPDPAMQDAWVCRPAAAQKTNFPTFGLPGIPSAGLVIGDVLYGMVPSNRFVGKDEPFVYDLAAQVFRTVAGITSGNVPTTQAATGDWTPPQITQVGSRILVTHPGFPGGATKFGWFDISGFSLSTTGNISTAFTVIGDTDQAGAPAYVVGNPIGTNGTTSIIAGSTITGAGIPANTIVLDTPLDAVATTGDITNASNVVTNMGTTTGVYVGQIINTVFMPATTVTVTAVGPGNQVTLSNAAIGTATGQAIWFGGSRIHLSQNVTATANNVTFTITPAAGTAAITGNPSIVGVQPGHTVSGAGIPAGTTVVSTRTIISTKPATVPAGSTIMQIGNGNTDGLTVGMSVFGLGIDTDTKIVGLAPAVNQITLSKPTIAGNTFPVTFTFTGSAITISQNPTATTTGVALTIAGGTSNAPLWGAGDTDRNNLPSTPRGVGQMNGRAWFACGTDGIPYSDALFPCRMSNTLAVQTLKANDGLAITAIAPLMLSALNPGGIVQALIAFAGNASMYQIQGDQTTLNLTFNRMPVATGTRAPNSIFTCELGTGFISNEGLRFVKFDGSISQPIGDAGTGITVPFINAVNPSRMCAAANSHFIRITTQNGAAAGQPFEEYWYDLGRQSWSGPHTSAAAMIQPWGATFVLALAGVSGVLFVSDVTPSAASTYTENGQPLQWTYAPCLLPDNQQVAMNSMVETLIAMSGPPTGVVQCEASNIDSVKITFLGATQWGGGAWDRAPWLGGGVYRQYSVPWSIPIVFKQLLLDFRGFSAPEVRLGNINMKWQILGYKNSLVAA